MPVTISAKKKLKQDIKRKKFNSIAKYAASRAIKTYRKNPSDKLLQKTFSLLDKMKKKKLFHANKVARLKSALSKLIVNKKNSTPEKKAKKKK